MREVPGYRAIHRANRPTSTIGVTSGPWTIVIGSKLGGGAAIVTHVLFPNQVGGKGQILGVGLAYLDLQGIEVRIRAVAHIFVGGFDAIWGIQRALGIEA